jgi:hypothetical protein
MVGDASQERMQRGQRLGERSAAAQPRLAISEVQVGDEGVDEAAVEVADEEELARLVRGEGLQRIEIRDAEGEEALGEERQEGRVERPAGGSADEAEAGSERGETGRAGHGVTDGPGTEIERAGGSGLSRDEGWLRLRPSMLAWRMSATRCTMRSRAR